MNNKHSWTRQVYKQAYAAMRRGFSDDYLAYNANFGRDIIKAADYSYQAFGYEDNGWLSDDRRKRFNAIKWRILSREELPF